MLASSNQETFTSENYSFVKEKVKGNTTSSDSFKHRQPFVYEEGSPKCFECGKSNKTKPVCRSCAKPFEFWIGQRSWKCKECVDIHDIAHEAASGKRSDMTPISEEKKGHKI